MTDSYSVIEYFDDGQSAYVECGLDAKRALTVASKRSRKACHNSNVIRVAIVNDDSSNIVLDWQRHVGTVTSSWRI